MGRDKTRLTLGGLTLLERALELLRDAGFTPGIAGLRAPVAFNIPVITDNFPDAGPLAGIEAALGSLAQEPPQPVLFVPVDLPLLPPSFLFELWERAQRSGALATVPWANGRPQPLCAVYRTELAEGLREALAREDRKVMRVLNRLVPPSRFDGFPVEAVASLRGWHAAHRWFWNLNTPGDWDALAAFPAP